MIYQHLLRNKYIIVMGVSRGNDFMLPIPPFLLSETVHSLLILQTLAHDVTVYVYFIILYQIKSLGCVAVWSKTIFPGY